MHGYTLFILTPSVTCAHVFVRSMCFLNPVLHSSKVVRYVETCGGLERNIEDGIHHVKVLLLRPFGIDIFVDIMILLQEQFH